MIFPYGERETAWLTKRDKKLGAAIEAIGMIERETRPDIFSSLVSSIVSQQISTAAARSVWARLTDRLGEVTPAAVSRVSADELRSCGVSLRKAGYIKAAAERALACELDGLSAADDEEFIRRIVLFPGVGRWTAEMLLIFSLCRPDVLSWGDLGIHRGMLALYGARHADASGTRVQREFFEARRARWSPYNSVASLYLWEIAGGAFSGSDQKATKVRKRMRSS